MIIACDLDRTLLPNGKEPSEPEALEQFYALIKETSSTLAYVTGRNLKLFHDAQREFGIRNPDYLLASVGTEIYIPCESSLIPDPNWKPYVLGRHPKWDASRIPQLLPEDGPLYLQEDFVQNAFKISYYIREPEVHASAIVERARRVFSDEGIGAEAVYSYDPHKELGLLDILPQSATKLGALQYLLDTLSLTKEDVIFCGDSGNDLLPLTSGMRAVLVKNASPEVKQEAEQKADELGIRDKLYIATGTVNLNGNYAAGVIEGIEHFLSTT